MTFSLTDRVAFDRYDSLESEEEREHRLNESNWCIGHLFYCNRGDSRTCVPKYHPLNGYTVNLGSPCGKLWCVVILLAILFPAALAIGFAVA